ncbi:DUF4124 domain-containing protein [Sulfuriflexus mobilis]|uniref:DUF4124 domain-containing protein n=1 Tax=Sulfuriflexus mobilis TaxID=1811807 RepID=UPI001558FB75|nr:DUF4124 domain-containing protein [Sulfuriflexus mobilis]
MSTLTFVPKVQGNHPEISCAARLHRRGLKTCPIKYSDPFDPYSLYKQLPSGTYFRKMRYNKFNMIMPRRSIILMALVLYSSLSCAEGIYRWVDEQGRVHFGDDEKASPKAEDISKDIKPNVVPDSHLGDYPKGLFNQSTGKAKNVTANIVKGDLFKPFSMSVYRLLPPLLPKARLLHIEGRRDSLWFASDIGLLEFNTKTEEWYLYNRKNGLPGDTAYDIATDGDRLFLKVLNWTGKNSLGGGGQYWFDAEKNHYEKTRLTIHQVRAGGSFTPENSDAMGYNPSHILHHRGHVWMTYTGNHRRTKGFKGGGVAMMHPLTKRGRQFTTADGLAHSYCHGITASEDKNVWVTHWEEERGLSFINHNAGRWQVVKKSRNGIELGGVKIAAVDNFILIGQQRALVIYDKKSQLAYSLDEAEGLPGYIVSDIMVDKNNIWVTAYGYHNGGSDRGGLVKIERAELHRFFERMVAADNEMQQQNKQN